MCRSFAILLVERGVLRGRHLFIYLYFLGWLVWFVAVIDALIRVSRCLVLARGWPTDVVITGRVWASDTFVFGLTLHSLLYRSAAIRCVLDAWPRPFILHPAINKVPVRSYSRTVGVSLPPVLLSHRKYTIIHEVDANSSRHL